MKQMNQSCEELSLAMKNRSIMGIPRKIVNRDEKINLLYANPMKNGYERLNKWICYVNPKKVVISEG